MPPSTARRQDFDRVAGNAWPLNFTITDADGVAVDLTSATEVIWVLVNRPGPSGTEYIRKTGGAGITNTGAGGVLEVRVNEEDTEDLAPGRYYYELRVTIGGDPITRYYGHITVRATAIQP